MVQAVSDESPELVALRAKVALMRELGISEDGGTKLGAAIAPPKPEETKEQYLARINRAAQRQHDIMFAASGTKPVLRVMKP